MQYFSHRIREKICALEKHSIQWGLNERIEYCALFCQTLSNKRWNAVNGHGSGGESGRIGVPWEGLMEMGSSLVELRSFLSARSKEDLTAGYDWKPTTHAVPG